MTPSQINRAVQLASDIAKPGIMPILANIVIGNGQVKATDLDSQITIAAPFDFDPYTVSASKFKGILATLDADAALSMSHKDGKLSIKSGRSKFTCPTLPSDDFPDMELGPVLGSVELDQVTFKKMLHVVQHAIPQNSAKMPSLNGALLDFTGEELTIVGCDTARMAWSSSPLLSQKMEAILPPRVIGRLIKILHDGVMTVTFHEGKAVFNIGDVEFITKLVAGKYPDWRRIIPKNPHQLQIDLEQLKGTIERAAIVLDKVRNSKVTISTTFEVACSNNGELASDDFPINWKHEAYTCGMNPDYLRDALSIMDGDEVTVHIGAGMAAWLIEGDGEVKAVVMPLKN